MACSTVLFILPKTPPSTLISLCDWCKSFYHSHCCSFYRSVVRSESGEGKGKNENEGGHRNGSSDNDDVSVIIDYNEVGGESDSSSSISPLSISSIPIHSIDNVQIIRNINDVNYIHGIHGKQDKNDLNRINEFQDRKMNVDSIRLYDDRSTSTDDDDGINQIREPGESSEMKLITKSHWKIAKRRRINKQRNDPIGIQGHGDKVRNNRDNNDGIQEFERKEGNKRNISEGKFQGKERGRDEGRGGAKEGGHSHSRGAGAILGWGVVGGLNWDVLFLLGGGFALSEGFQVSECRVRMYNNSL